MRSLPFRILRRIVFQVGHTRWISHFPFFTWADRVPKIDLNEALMEAAPKLQPGDVVLHRDDGFWSNWFIGGAMIHAGLYVGNGQLVEALREGVVKRHVGHILYSDRACIVRPNVGPQAVEDAVQWADKTIGYDYDVLFDFNGQEEREMLRTMPFEKAKKRVRFCCTEIPYFCYFDHAESLRLFRRRNINALTRFISWFGLHPGEKIIDADMYVTGNFELIWCSKLFTPEWSEAMKCSEGFVTQIRNWWKGRK